MRTDAPVHARPNEVLPRRPQLLGGSPTAGADLFASLLQAAEPSAARQPDAGTPPAQPPPEAALADKHPALQPEKSLPPFTALMHPAPPTDKAAAHPGPCAPAHLPHAASATEPDSTPHTAQGKEAAQQPTFGAFVSTIAQAQGKTATMQSVPKLLASLIQGGRAALAPPNPAPALRSDAPLPVRHMPSPGQAATALAEALGSSEESGLGMPSSLSTLERAGAGPRDSSGQGHTGGGHGAALEGSSNSPASSETSATGADFSQQLSEALQPGLEAAYESINHQISLWAAGQTKRANLLLHDGLHQTLEIEIKLDGQQAQLDFLTNDEQLRESLRSQAQEALSELLGQNGLELVGLSIGSRASGQSDRSTAQRPQASSARSEVADTSADQPTVVLQPATGRAGLSVYA